MRKICTFMMVSIDGYFEGVDHDLSWHNVDDEFNLFAVEQLDKSDTLVFGRRTYELMANFWPSKEALSADPATAERMNNYHKVVFSKSMDTANWNNSVLANSPATTLQSLKEKAGKDVLVLGSSNLCVTLLRENLIDEIRLMLNPVILGSGTQLFAGLNKRLKLTLMDNRQFKSGNTLLTYKVD